MTIPVSDPFGAAADPDLPSVGAALDPGEAERRLGRLDRLTGAGGGLELHAIEVIRHKPGRRCMIAYELEVDPGPDAPPEPFTAIGKIRFKRFGKSGFRLLDGLWRAGFDAASIDGISVPEPLGTISEFRMWLQRKVSGPVVTELVPGPDGEPLGRRVAEAAHKIHRAGIPPDRGHTMADELNVLEHGLARVMEEQPRLEPRLGRLFDACARLAATTPDSARCPIHRDYYADQLIVDSSRLHVIDFDLYCEGDPALDIGNFLGHLTEQSLRTLGTPDALAGVEAAVEERYLELAGVGARSAVRTYAALTLARHVYLSTCFADRRPFTEALLELCEERLGVAAGTRPPAAPGAPHASPGEQLQQ